MSLSSQKLVQLLKNNNIRPKKKSGQNFLISNYITEKIVKNCKLNDNDIILEIGAGVGNLTKYLIKKCNRVVAVEKDRRLAEVMKKNLKRRNLKIVCEDILNFDMKNLAGEEKIKVIGNLPYYISSDIIQYILKNRNFISCFYCSLQKEFAERIVAPSGSKKYGRLTIFVNYYASPSILFNISSDCFYPQPEVDSCFMKIHIDSKPSVKVENEKFFLDLIKAGFSTRRKKLSNCLKNWIGNRISKQDLIEFLKQVGIDKNVRAEDLNIQEFAFLSNYIYKYLSI